MTQKIHILGLGAMGQLFAHQLHQSQFLPVGIVRNTHAKQSDETQSKTLTLINADGTKREFVIDIQPANQNSDIKELLISCKSIDTISAIRPLLDCIDLKANIYLIQNGNPETISPVHTSKKLDKHEMIKEA